FYCRIPGQAIQEIRIDHITRFRVEIFIGDVAVWSFEHIDNGKIKMLCKGKVTCVAGGHRHHRAGAIAGKDIVGDPYRHLLLVERIKAVRTREYATDTLHLTHPFAFRTVAGNFNIGSHCLALFGRGDPFHQLMFGGKYHEGYAKDGIDAGSENAYRIVTFFKFEVELAAYRLADPVALH